MHLYELTDQIKFLQEDTELEEEEFAKKLGEIQGRFEDKAENIGKLYLSLQADVNALKSEEERLESRRQTIERKSEWLKRYLLQELIVANIDKVKRDVLTISVRVNPPSVNVVDEEVIPQEFRRVIPETWQPDKKQIIEHFKNTGEIIAGVEMITDKKRVEIK